MLATVTIPTLLLHGDRDVRAPQEVANALHAAIPESKMVVLPGVGHVSPVEAPELFNREVRIFLGECAS
jgi:pimeloyl-ACP methyl ester carboxylesterase